MEWWAKVTAQNGGRARVKPKNQPGRVVLALSPVKTHQTVGGSCFSAKWVPPSHNHGNGTSEP